ncbi:MAG: hypothetical protein MUC35_01975 [Candidatus Margulisbacteria bacterium]|nr:hypothetical protein [Candidatus Margulisiibacteriota bacterium]
MSQFRKDFTSVFRLAVQGRDKPFLSRLFLLQQKLGPRAHSELFAIIKELRKGSGLTYQEINLFWRALFYRSFELTPMAGAARMEDFADETGLIAHLQSGGKIIAYRALQSQVAPYPIGTILNNPAPNARDAERELEEVRSQRFPEIPPRNNSIFLAPSIGVAQRFGAHFYEVEMSFKSARTTGQLPVRWLRLAPVEDYFRLWQDREQFEGTIDVYPKIEEYLSSRGSHHEDSEILADPQQVLLRVIRRIA